MNEFMKIVLSLSASGTLLLLLILGLKLLYKNKCGRRWQYYIWIIVAMRFLIPFTPAPFNVGSLFEKVSTAVMINEHSVSSASTDNPASSNMPAAVNADDSENGGESQQRQIQQEQTQGTQEQEAQADENAAADITAANHSLDVFTYLFFLWVIAALVLFIRKITIYQGFIRCIKACNTEISDSKTLNLLSDCEEKLNIKTRVELSCNPLIASPMLIGFFRPRIILPVGEWKDKELSYIFVHELIHYKQRDMFYKWLIQMVICIHWFNPCVYILEKEVNRACELSCDEAVISMLDDKARREYGDMLISFLKSNLKPNNLYQNSLASITLTEGAEQLKERLGAIMKCKKKSKTVIAITALFSAVVCACFFVTGVYAVSLTVSDNTTWKDGEILNEVLTEDGVYYIFCDGAEEKDKPLSSVSAGSIKFVLVRKDSYTSIGPFNHLKTLTEDVAKQCEYMKSLTQEEKELVIKTAADVCKENLDFDRHEEISPQIAKYYEADSLPLFQIEFSRLDEAAQRAWMDRTYADEEVAFFSVCVSGLRAGSPLIESFAGKCYEDDAVSFFSILMGSMSREMLEEYLDRAIGDKKTSFQVMLLSELDRDEELDALEKEWEEELMRKYQAVGVTKDGKNYYYKGELVNVIFDLRPNSSFHMLNVNPEGRVNIKIVRNAENEIIGVSYMSEEEVKELFEDDNKTSRTNIKDMSIIHESADILYYEDGTPYIHDILTNNTDRTIVETQYCMLAYDKNGSPLKLYWNFLDSSTESSYENIVQSKEKLLSGQTENYRGGWSLDTTNQAAYSLFCLKSVVFEDGTVWNNPGYENWFKTYAGKTVEIDELQNYYPHEYEIRLE